MKIYFNTSVLLLILISNTFSKTIYNTKTAVDEDNIKLNNFMNLLHNAQIDLKWIRDTNQLYRNKKSDSSWSYKPNMNFISVGDNRNLGDKWYKKFRDDEIKVTLPMNSISQQVMDNNIAIMPEGSNAAVSPDNDKAVIPEGKQLIGENLQDQSETTKNDLSHEANYKLSKYEQEKEEKNRVDKENKLKLLHSMPNSGFLTKRKIDPSEEIRLKIRSRMADKFETFVERHMNIDNVSVYDDYDAYLRSHRKIPNYNLFKRETPETVDRGFTSRKLLDYDYEDDNSFDSAADNNQKYRNYFDNRNKRQKTDQNLNSQTIINEMLTGILPNRLVKAIFTLAQKNDNFCKLIVPNVKISSFVEIKKSDVKQQAGKSDDIKKKTNDMISKIVKSITQLVDEQVKGQTCVPIKPELKQFVNKLLFVRQNSKILSTKFEFPIFSRYQEQNLAIGDEIDRNRFVRSPIPIHFDTETINNKYSVIRNLQNSFQKLTSPEQIRYDTMKKFVDKHLSLLDELNELSKLSRRNVLAAKRNGDIRQPVKRDAFNYGIEEEFNPELNMIEIKQPFNDQMTERFIKLSKMVEFMRQNSMLDTTNYDFIGNDFIL